MGGADAVRESSGRRASPTEIAVKIVTGGSVDGKVGAGLRTGLWRRISVAESRE